MLFSGALTALVTPFKNNTVDEEAYRAFIERQITEAELKESVRIRKGKKTFHKVCL